MERYENWRRDKGSEAGGVLKVWREIDGNRWIRVSKDAAAEYYVDILKPAFGVGVKAIYSEKFATREEAIEKAKEKLEELDTKGRSEDLFSKDYLAGL